MIFPARNLHLFLGFSMAMLVITRWYIEACPEAPYWGDFAHQERVILDHLIMSWIPKRRLRSAGAVGGLGIGPPLNSWI